LEVLCAVYHVDNFDGIGDDAIEDKVVPVNDPPDAAISGERVAADTPAALKSAWRNGL
jgi:hypothetical protein